MATPSISGIAAIVRQYYMKGFYPSGHIRQPDAFTPSAALLKATIIHSAVSISGALDENNKYRKFIIYY